MTFLDEDERHKYHKAPALLQVICQIFENYLVRWHLQCEVIEVEDMGCRLAVYSPSESDVEYHALTDAVIKLNEQFKRLDKKPTMSIIDADNAIVNIFVSETRDFSSAH